MDIRADRASAMAFVPEDRLGMGLVGSMGMTDNMMLQAATAAAKGPLLDRKSPRELAERIDRGAGRRDART